MTNQELNCEQVIERLFEYLDGELDRQDSLSVEHHLARCRDCFTRSEFEKRLRTRLAESVDTPAPDSLRQRVRALMKRF